MIKAGGSLRSAIQANPPVAPYLGQAQPQGIGASQDTRDVRDAAGLQTIGVQDGADRVRLRGGVDW